MAYTSTADLVFTAGGEQNLIELADHDSDGVADVDVLARAQEQAAELIDGYARRLFDLPGDFTPTPPGIRDIAAEEAIYIMKTWRPALVAESDVITRSQRMLKLKDLELGRWNPVQGDNYPRRDGGGTPIAVERTEDRDAFKGYC